MGKMKLEAGPHAPLVISRLEDKNEKVRLRAVWALKEMTARKLEPHKKQIAHTLEHRNAAVRMGAAEIMGFMGPLALDIHGVNATMLEQLLRDDDVDVRRTTLDAFFKWGVHARPCIKSIAKCLEDPDPLVRKLACMVLGKLGRPALVYEHEIAVLLTDPDKMVRKVALAAIERIKV
jgi:HEAT repeat protein